MNYLPYGRQNIGQDDIDSVVSVLQSDFLTQGPAGPKFEDALTAYSGAKFAKLTNSATSALHISCLALGIGPGDLVWTSPISFVASANAALYCGADVGFIDIDPETNNISLGKLEEELELRRSKSLPLPSLLIIVHLAGAPMDMIGVARLASEFNFKVIEDASHAVGAIYRGGKIGACEYSDLTVFSFHPVKIVTSGEGGAVLTNSRELARKVELLRSHGITRDPGEMAKAPDGPWYYEQQVLGFNYRMTDIQAALGNSQLQKIEDFIQKRHDIVEVYNELLAEIDLQRPALTAGADSRSAWHLYVVRIPEGSALGTRGQVFERLRANGIGVNLHYIPIYRQPYYGKFGYRAEEFPESEKYYKEAISLPIFPGLSPREQGRVVDLLKAQTGHQNIF